MSHREGAYLGSIRCLDTLRQACVVGAGCWHLRSARGRPMPAGSTHRFFLHGFGNVSATRAALYLATGKWAGKGRRVVRVCGSHDCVKPDHLRSWTNKQWGQWLSETGRSATTAKTIAARRTARSRSRLTAELRQWIIEAPQKGPDVAHAIGAATTWINTLRKRAASDPAAWRATQ